MKKAVLAVTAAAIVALGIFLWNVNRTERKDASVAAEWNEKRRPLEVKKSQLERQLEKLERDFASLTEPKATVQLVFTDLDERIYTICYPVMKKYEFSGTMVLSEGQLPGDEGRVTREQFRELTDAGWKVCVGWESGRAPNRWWPGLREELARLGVESVSSVFFPIGSYSAGSDTQIRQTGASIAVIEKNENEDPLQRQLEDGIWHLGAIGFMTSRPKAALRDAVADDANVAYLIDFAEGNRLYDEASFNAMLQSFDEYEASGDLSVCDADAARAQYVSRENGADREQEEEYLREKAAIEAQIADAEEELSRIDAEYE